MGHYDEQREFAERYAREHGRPAPWGVGPPDPPPYTGEDVAGDSEVQAHEAAPADLSTRLRGPHWVLFRGDQEPTIVDFKGALTAALPDGTVVDYNILDDYLRVGAQYADKAMVWVIPPPPQVQRTVVELRYRVRVPVSVLQEHGREAAHGAARAALIAHLGGKLRGKASARPPYLTEAATQRYHVEEV